MEIKLTKVPIVSSTTKLYPMVKEIGGQALIVLRLDNKSTDEYPGQEVIAIYADQLERVIDALKNPIDPYYQDE